MGPDFEEWCAETKKSKKEPWYDGEAEKVEEAAERPPGGWGDAYVEGCDGKDVWGEEG
jgi:hypothetical protein